VVRKDHLKLLAWNLIGVAIVAAVHAMGLFDRFEEASVKARYWARGPVSPDPRVAVVTIDQKSVNEMGPYPWSRDRHAQLISLLSQHGAKTVAFDVLFLEPDVDNPDDDDFLAAAAAKSDRVVFGMLFNKTRKGAPAEPLFPIPALERVDANFGFVNVYPEISGLVSKTPLWVEYDGTFVPSLALATVATHEGKTPEALAKELRAVTENRWHEAHLNYTGWHAQMDWPESSPFPFYSFVDVLRGRVDTSVFKDKIVIVGGTLHALFDYKPTVVSSVFPGLEIQANAVNNLLKNNFLRRVDTRWLLLIMLLIGVLWGFGMARAPIWAGATAVILSILGYTFLTYWLFSRHLLLINFATPLFAFFAAFLATLIFQLDTSHREQEAIRNLFAEYTPPKLIDLMLNDPSKLKLGGEEREITVFFSDIAGFTGISESMEPGRVVEMLNDYQKSMTDVVFKYDGYLDKYIGDAIMAFWNAPLDQPNHPVLACRAALEQTHALNEFNRRMALQGIAPVRARMGLHTGRALVGRMGPDSRRTYTAIGDSINLGSRLEGANKFYGTGMIVSEPTYKAAEPDIEARELDLVRVQGKTQAILIYELLGKKNALSPEKKQAYKQFVEGVALYRGRKFTEALDCFEDVRRVLPEDGPTFIYIKRCRHFLEAPPPPDWDGVHTMTSK
jgi:adenylate cyclase